LYVKWRPFLKTLILDAMGVIYSEGDDGHNLLLPFIQEKVGSIDYSELVKLYSAASLGRISAPQFWKSLGIDPALEDEYLQRHRLSDGLIEFLEAVNSSGVELWCLSNDFSDWSRKLRLRFGLDRYFRGFVISGDVGIRKPDRAIYLHLMEKAGINPSDAVFVDDRPRNLAPAEELGLATILFNPTPEDSYGHGYRIVRTFPELMALLQNK
jgi:HAD superfamily hydrolase (TIGR01509 family)